MPGMPVGQVHVNQPLSNLAILYRPFDSGFIADEVAPILPVSNESDSYYVWTQGDFFATDTSDLVPDRAEPRAVEFAASTSQYQTKRRELAWDISDRERKNADDQLRLERVKQEGVLGRLAILRDMRIEALLNISSTTTTVAGESISGGLDTSMTAAKTAFWDGAATTYQSVFTDVIKGRTKMRQSIGAQPNVLVIPAQVAEGLHKSLFFSSTAGPQIVYQTAPAEVAAYNQYPLLPERLWGMRVLTPGNIKNTAVEGQTASYSDIFGETVRMVYVTPNPDIENPSWAYTFQSEPFETRQARDDRKRLDWFAAGRNIDERAVASFAGYTITDCLT
jgi:hypothetical protein